MNELPTKGATGGIVPDNPDRERIAAAKRRRRRISIVSLAVVVLLVATGGGFWLLQHQRELDRRAEEHQRQICPGLGDTTGPGFALSMIDGECIGWTSEQDFGFAPDIQDITTRIVAQNQVVSRRWSAPDNGRSAIPYVRVAVFMPMTGDATSSLSAETIRHSLEGIYTAQARANDLDHPQFRSSAPGIQVLLVNEGKSQTHWPRVVDQLAGLTGGEHPLVAAVGLGISVPETKAAAAELSRRGITAVGAVVTATDMTADRFFKVSPSNLDYIMSLQAYLAARPDLRAGYLVYDSNDDNYVRTLREAFEQQFGSRYLLDKRRTSYAGSKKPAVASPALFGHAVDNICATQADVIFYAGRDRDLPALINALASRGQCGHDKPITIVTGATGLGQIQRNPTAQDQLTTAQVSIIDASATSPVDWGNGDQAPPGYRAFHDYFRTVLGLPEDSLIDGYAIMHHDALATVVWATRLAAEESPDQNGTPSTDDVYLRITNLHGTKPVPAASGDLSFDDISDGWPHGKVVPIIPIPGRPIPADVYTTP